jgi:hypothetical protein
VIGWFANLDSVSITLEWKIGGQEQTRIKINVYPIKYHTKEKGKAKLWWLEKWVI